jgi:hypothetical protein
MILEPKGDDLLDFVCVNISVFDDGVDLLAPSLIDKLKYFLLKRRIRKYWNHLRHIDYNRYNSCDQILGNFDNSKNSWDRLLIYTIIQLTILDLKNTRGDIVDLTMRVFKSYVDQFHDLGNKLLDIELNLLRIKIDSDLIQFVNR